MTEQNMGFKLNRLPAEGERGVSQSPWVVNLGKLVWFVIGSEAGRGGIRHEDQKTDYEAVGCRAITRKNVLRMDQNKLWPWHRREGRVECQRPFGRSHLIDLDGIQPESRQSTIDSGDGDRDKQGYNTVPQSAGIFRTVGRLLDFIYVYNDVVHSSSNYPVSNYRM